jgi:ribulose-phosphate 3-epimerase
VPQCSGIIAPSVLSADFGRLADEVRAATSAGADWLHIDVMDGHFVPNITMGPAAVKAIRKATPLPLDVHLMITDPLRYLGEFIAAGADSVSVHHEACPDVGRAVDAIHAAGARAAVAINPDTPVSVLSDVVPSLDMVLVMSVNPGFGGQEFIEAAIPKLREAAHLRQRRGLSLLIEVDGGITVANAGRAAEAGADVIVAGTAVFRAPDYGQAIAALRSSIAQAFA